MEIQQSSHYAAFIESLGWKVESVDGSFIYIKTFPLIGGLAKLQRVKNLPALSRLLPILTHHHVRTLAIEPDSSVNQTAFYQWVNKATKHIRINTDYFLPTKTIRVDLRPSEQEIFNRFTQSKRRAVRRAEKLGVTVHQSHDIHAFLHMKNTSAGLLGFITTTGIDKLWRVFPEKHKMLLVAYTNNNNLSKSPFGKNDKKIIGGVMLLFWERVAYYWIAGALPQGKKLFAPTYLVWEALKQSKKRGCAVFDFIGVWDDRLPTKNHEWKGFTKFKEGFGGVPLYYPYTPQNS